MPNLSTIQEKIILIALSGIFIIVLIAVGWDLYGRQLWTTKMANQLISTQEGFQEQPPNQSDLGLPQPVNGTGSANKKQPPANKAAANKQPAAKNKTTENIDPQLYAVCLEKTVDERASKDCCDCLNADAAVRKACRDATVSYDFSKNTTFQTFEIPSKLGKNGDYSACTASGNQQQCKQCCDSSTQYVCGDFQYCRTACNNLAP